MMSKTKHLMLIATIAVAGLAAGIFTATLQPLSAKTVATAPETGADLLNTPLPGLDGKQRKLSDWKGKVVIVNFWATWCQPCRQEIPEFVELQNKYRAKGVQFVGIALDESAAVSKFSKELGMNYPILLGEEQAMEMMRTAGNKVGGLPFTTILDRQGKIVSIAAGKLSKARLEAAIEQVLG
ncbi:thiol-disulfide isomerase/thioredoxin [Chitinivorax tropicus]|uniref:Thiol-disulfide isomerase/thioredoxin n=1 Tax=Chitinivorax tropicus TaxID=714531 RepID=A0A840MLP4_9PROT|nr:TlpA disulfide reductase family protein [Chitinivorax tropicus]MBB5017456.1 thiol-disulfide isomerase/thioredoxin [Chitinivorax tropicus]